MNNLVSTLAQNVPGSAQAPVYKWALSLVMVAVLALGWKYPAWGFVVPAAMLTGIVGSLYRGRWVCGNVCPRGSFLDSWFKVVAGRRPIPALLKAPWFRWTTLSLLIGFMIFRLAQNPGDAAHWGRVFWQMCALTTLAAVLLGLRYSARSWCSFCPVGTLGSSLGGEKFQLRVADACKGCGVCRQSCPLQINVAQYRSVGTVQDRDCLKCSGCVQACPRQGVLSWPSRQAA